MFNIKHTDVKPQGETTGLVSSLDTLQTQQLTKRGDIQRNISCFLSEATRMPLFTLQQESLITPSITSCLGKKLKNMCTKGNYLLHTIVRN